MYCLKAAKFVSGKDYKNNKDTMESDGFFVAYWDSTASGLYWFNAEKAFATGDNKNRLR